MKIIGIIGAMEEEIASLKSKMELVTAKNIVGIDFYMGKMNGKSVVLVRSGIGKVNAAICTQVLIDLYAVDYIINVGVAGAISKELSIGDVVISKDVVHHDMDCTNFGYEQGIIPRMTESFFTADELLIKIAKECGEEALPNKAIHVNRIASGDKFVSSNEDKQKIWSAFKAFCVEMEGAAIAQTCFLNKIPFIVIRAISDKADDSAGVSFDKFVLEAAKTSSELVEKMIAKL